MAAGCPNAASGNAPAKTLVNAEAPEIIDQPEGAVYMVNAASTPMGVTAEVFDGGSLSYRWYSNSVNSYEGGKLIPGETGPWYTPPTVTVGTSYYYVTVTNTIPHNGDGGNKTASVTSSITPVTVTGNDGIIPVSGIGDVPDLAYAGIPLALSGTVSPPNATFKDIVWSVKNAGTTGASISGGILNATAAGTVTVTATIANGAALGTDYTQDFAITVNPESAEFVAVTGISGVPAAATAGFPLTLTGTVSPGNADNKTISWSVKNAGTTGASINGNVLNTMAEGTAIVTASIANGSAPGTDYTQDFTIIVNNASFTAVSKISGIPDISYVEVPLALYGTLVPSNATMRAIIWSVKYPGTTEAIISGNTLYSASAGTVVITATITDGISYGMNYTQDFSIEVLIPVADISNVPETAYALTPLSLDGTISPSNASNQNISWSVKDAGTTGAEITGNVLNTMSWGTVIVTAAIANGSPPGVDYVQDFTIAVYLTQPTLFLSAENFSMIDEGSGIFDSLPPIILSKSAGASRSISMSGFSGVVWYLGNLKLAEGNSLTINAVNFNTGAYTLSITFIKDAKPWSTSLTFAITE